MIIFLSIFFLCPVCLDVGQFADRRFLRLFQSRLFQVKVIGSFSKIFYSFLMNTKNRNHLNKKSSKEKNGYHTTDISLNGVDALAHSRRPYCDSENTSDLLPAFFHTRKLAWNATHNQLIHDQSIHLFYRHLDSYLYSYYYLYYYLFFNIISIE